MARLLSVENKGNRVANSKTISALCYRNPDESLRRQLTVGETFILYMLHRQRNSKKVVFRRRTTSEMDKDNENDKVMATVFLDALRTIFTDYLNNGKTNHEIKVRIITISTIFPCFHELPQSYCLDGLKKVGETLEKVRRAKRKLC